MKKIFRMIFNKIMIVFDRIIEKEAKRVFVFNNIIMGRGLSKGGAWFVRNKRRPIS